MKYARKPKKYGLKGKKQIRAVVKASRALMLRSVETKHYNYGVSGSISNDDFFSFSPTQQIVIGTNANTRIGDSILLQSFTMNMSAIVNTGTLSCKWRFILGWSRSQVANATIATGSLSSSDVFYPPTNTSVNMANRIVNTNVFTPIYDEIADVNSVNGGKDIKSTYAVVKLGLKKFDYATLSGTHGKTKNLFFIAIAYVPGAALSATIGEMNGTFQLKFKDP